MTACSQHRLHRYSPTRTRRGSGSAQLMLQENPPVKNTDKRSIRNSQCNGQKILLDPDNVEKGLAKLVLIILELLRKLLERQAIRRMDQGQLTEIQIERMGQTLMKLEEKIEDLRKLFGLTDDDLNIKLGPLGNLM